MTTITVNPAFLDEMVRQLDERARETLDFNRLKGLYTVANLLENISEELKAGNSILVSKETRPTVFYHINREI